MSGQCSTCGSIGSVERGFYKQGFAEDDHPLPPEVTSLAEVASNVSGGRGHTLYRCPRCGSYFDYELDYEFIVPGTEDFETLRRISLAEARALRSRIEAGR